MGGNVVKIGQMEIRYLVDGAEKGGLGLFELKVPPGPTFPRRTAIPGTRSASTCWRARFGTRSIRSRVT